MRYLSRFEKLGAFNIGLALGTGVFAAILWLAR